ncbi:MobF family relaxase [Streptacidiphilus anmyonensis]|uniref:MobF family relaxase n=1 Tax=Streptacidiphilus anmyonensis TaxID=405782 RepID=UPI0005A737AE|nr:MobF family relaxase [Streptacidiphilus anmyonensis]
MARIVKIKAGQKARVRYWTQGHGGCTTVAVLAREPVWAGAGLAGLGLVAGERVDQVAAQWLMEGRHPLTGQMLREPRTEAHPHAKLDGAPFAAALRELAAGRGLEPGQVLRSGRSRERWGRLERALAKAETEKHTASKGPKKPGGRKRADASVSYTDLRRLAKDAGLRLEDLYDPSVLEFAWVNRDKQRLVGVAAFGMFVAWPKSISVVAALAPPSVGRVISQAVAETMTELVAAIETLAGYGSRGRQGGGQLSRRIDGRGLAAIVLPHFLARRTKDGPGDPHLHAHLTIPNLLQGDDEAWGGFGGGGHDLYRHVAVLGELAKARLRQRLHARLGMTFVFEPVTGEWEVAGVPLALRRAWSSRREEILEAAGPGASAAARRAASAKLSERRRETVWEPVLLMERWHTFATDLVDDVPAMFASAVPGAAAAPVEPPTVEEIAARLQLPRVAAVRRKGAEYREILAAVIKAFPDNLTSLEQALEMTDQVLAHAGFVALPHRDATAFRNAERYRVPAALVATSRNPVDWPDPRDAVTTSQAPAKAQKTGQAQQHLDLALTEPGRTRRRHPQPRPATPADWTDQIEMDLGLNQPATGPAGHDAGTGEQTPTEPVDERRAERPHRMLVGEDLAAALTAAETAYAQALAAADTNALAAVALMADARGGKGKAWQALRARRLRLEEAAVMARTRTEMLKQVESDRESGKALQDRAKALRELAEEKSRNLIGWKRTGFTDAQRDKALALARDPGDEQPDGSGTRMNRADARRHAARLEKQATDIEKTTEETEKSAGLLYASAVEIAAAVGETAEAAVLEDGWAPWRKAAAEQRAVAVDVAAAAQARQDRARRDRAAVGAARGALDQLRAEQNLRARMPSALRASEDLERAEAAERARAAARAAQEQAAINREARADEQRRFQGRAGGTGRTR